MNLLFLAGDTLNIIGSDYKYHRLMKEPQRTVGGLFKKCTLSADILLLLLKYPLYFFKMTRLSNNSTRNCLLLSQISSKDCRLVPCMSDCHPCSDCWPDCCVCASSGWDLTGVSLWSPAGWWLPLELLFSDGSLHRPPPRTKYQQSVHNTHQYNQPVRRQCIVLTELWWKVLHISMIYGNFQIDSFPYQEQN